MPLFVWEARTSAGEIRGGELAGVDEVQVIEALRRRGLRVTRVDRSARRGAPRLAEAPAEALLPALRQFLTLRTAGVGAAEALELGARSSRGAVARALHAAQLAVESGAGVGEAFAQHAATFGALAARSLGEADARGLFDATLAALIELLAKADAARLAVRAAAVRTVAAVAVLLGGAAALSLVLVPAVGGLYRRLDLLPTGAAADVLAVAPWLSLGTGLFAAAVVVAAALLAAFPSLRAGALGLTAGLAEALRRLALARFARALALLATAEAPRQVALELAGWEAGDRELAEAAQRARAGVAQGGELGAALAEAGLPAGFARAVLAADRGGELAATLRRLAEAEEDAALQWLSRRTGQVALVCYAASATLAVTAALALAAPLLRQG
ncbi:Type II secretory pathway, component PulF [Nannocystis exedens]|uniref:Type II secretory pathway, component PulF n=1 Tax=Nannocystis exedens TaxID=54 RepID=A0A1I2HCN6_9BACT|nr:type II secretion system F family protein [Nannocystis exedens]PCC70046.1 type IV pilin biogenesis protein [Nannocystis exedens]SFF26526.1 Type II secretory pathway, component PulF [Nannocystis exedens]